jgi:GMP synthase (glutamine-hydrolysing)
MPSILVIKTGSTLPALKRQIGDFEDWTLSGMDLPAGEARVVDVTAGAAIPDYDSVRGVVITGSHSMVTDRLDWSERTAGWLRGAVARRIPTLGICYGHQLLAHALGGEVGPNPRGLEYGTFEVDLLEPAREDKLLGGLPGSLRVQLCHVQSVLRLPIGAVRLASNAKGDNQAFRLAECVWGVQFHPEFNAHVVRAYVNHMRLPLTAEEQDLEGLLSTCADTPASGEILKRFARLVGAGPAEPHQP